MNCAMEAVPLKREALLRTRQYGVEARALQRAQIDNGYGAEIRHAASMDQRLEQTLKMMQERVEKQRDDLEKLRLTLPSNVAIPRKPSKKPREHLRQLRHIKDAYERLSPASPNALALQPPSSIFPALLALRNVHQTIANTKTAIQKTRKEISCAEDELARERNMRQKAQELSAALEAYITRANRTNGNGQNSNGSDGEEERKRVRDNLFAALDTREARCVALQQETQAIREALVAFIRTELSSMLAAGEVGILTDEEEPDVMEKYGYDAGDDVKGGAKLLSAERFRERNDREAEKSQSRTAETRNRKGYTDNLSHDYASRKEDIAHEMEQIIDNLIDTMRSNKTSPYITLSQESLQAMYLVNAKVAKFHPEDARQLRLVDFR